MVTLGLAMPEKQAVAFDSPENTITPAAEPSNLPMPFDENLLERARTQWQFGDWQSLAEIPRDSLQHHPERAKLALLAASGHQQLGDKTKTREFLQLAHDWGCNKNLLNRVLVAGVFSSLGRAQMAKGNEKAALTRYQDAIRLVQPNAHSRLLSQARAVRDSNRMGLLPQAAKLIDQQVRVIRDRGRATNAQIKILETEIELLHHELSLAQQRGQLNSQRGARSHLIAGSNEWKAGLKEKAVSQLGQDLWVLERTNYKRDGFFVEFGATDGVLLSNTWLLEREFGWQGICAEPNPRFFAQLQHNRSCILSDQCIGGATGEQVEFIFADAYGGSQNYADDDQHKDKRAAYRAAGQMALLTTISLHDFLLQHNAPQVIDYLSIDTEGSEYEILQAFPFNLWDIRLITVEHNFTERRRDIRKLLEGHGYSCREAQWDDWFEKGMT
jgi:FkbM family methyltransferase